MKIIVHRPLASAGQAELKRRVARAYAQTVVNKINRLPCTPQKKMRLLEAAAKKTLPDSDISNSE